MTTSSYLLLGGTPSAVGGGSTSERIIGSGDSFPSFPGVVDYNGLVLNNQDEIDYYHITNIDGLDDAEMRDNRTPKTNADGENAYGTWYGGRPIVINGEIRAKHLWKLDDMRNDLISCFARKDKEYPLRLRNGGANRDRIIMCKKNAKLEIPMIAPTKQEPVLPFMIPLRASDPRLLSYLNESFNYADGDATSFSLVNEGNYEAKLIIRFYGPAAQYVLTRIYDGVLQTIIVENIAANEYVEVNGTTNGIKVTDQAGANAYSHYSDDSEIMMLGPSPLENGFDVYPTGTDTGAGVYLQWNHSWIG